MSRKAFDAEAVDDAFEDYRQQTIDAMVVRDGYERAAAEVAFDATPHAEHNAGFHYWLKRKDYDAD